MPHTVDVALAAPLWKALSYAVPAELVNLVKPLSRLLVPLRGGQSLGFALSPPAPGDATGLKSILDVLDEVESAQACPAELLQFYQRAASYYQAPLGQVLAQSLPAGMGTSRPKGGRLPKAESVAHVSVRQGMAKNLPRVGTQADRLLRLLQKNGTMPLPDLRKMFTQAGALSKRLEAAGWVEIHQKPLVRDLLGNPLRDEPPPECLNPDQAKAVKQINKHVDSTEFKAILLFGVTGSGKTEVYLAACERALRNGRQALILVPEIGLCLRLEGLLKSRLEPGRVAVLHSGLTPAARRGQWMAIARGEADVVVGARSAVFAPLKNPGVICVDEEQDEAYKQEDRFPYNGRDLALLRGQEQGCPVLMGTATPSASTWHRADSGAYEKLILPKRINDAALPKMSLVDLRSAGRLKGGFLSAQLHQALKKTVSAGNQAILFLNRRGYAPALICAKCGKTTGCPSCSLSLTVHRSAKRLTCHTCGHTQAPAHTMPPLRGRVR
jgi:primosomal protein N' (replication factor Y)